MGPTHTQRYDHMQAGLLGCPWDLSSTWIVFYSIPHYGGSLVFLKHIHDLTSLLLKCLHLLKWPVCKAFDPDCIPDLYPTWMQEWTHKCNHCRIVGNNKRLETVQMGGAGWVHHCTSNQWNTTQPQDEGGSSSYIQVAWSTPVILRVRFFDEQCHLGAWWERMTSGPSLDPLNTRPWSEAPQSVF